MISFVRSLLSHRLPKRMVCTVEYVNIKGTYLEFVVREQGSTSTRALRHVPTLSIRQLYKNDTVASEEMWRIHQKIYVNRLVEISYSPDLIVETILFI